MNTKSLANHYSQLTPEEGFRLMLAAEARGDEAERERLINAGQRITMTRHSHAPFAHAFQEIALLVYIELIEEAAVYADLGLRAADVREDDADDAMGHDRSLQRFLASALAAAYLLKTKAVGWKLFCERLGAPPFTTPEIAGLPGLDRLKDALDRAEKCAFTQKGLTRWCNGIRPAGKPKVTEADIITAEKSADNLESLFRQRVEWWGGEAKS